MTPNDLANKMNQIKDKAEPIYIPLAKFALWLTAAVLLVVTYFSIRNVYHVWTVARMTDNEAVTNIVAACQVLAFITLAVLGYRGGKGMLK